MAPVATSADASVEELSRLLALDPPVIRPPVVEAASMRIEDGDLPPALVLADAIVEEHRRPDRPDRPGG